MHIFLDSSEDLAKIQALDRAIQPLIQECQLQAKEIDDLLDVYEKAVRDSMINQLSTISTGSHLLRVHSYVYIFINIPVDGSHFRCLLLVGG